MTNNTMNWLDLSEVVFGLVVTKRVPVTKFHKELFTAPYDDGFESYFKGASKTKLSATLGPALESAIEAAGTISDENTQDVEWWKNLLYASKAYTLGKQLEVASKKLIRGEIIKPEDATQYAASFKDISDPDSIGLIISKDVDLENFEPTMLSGYPPIDSNLGGIPVAGNILVMATTGQGKSLFSQQFTGHFLNQYTEKKAAIWSLEMTNQQYLSRGLKLYPLFRKAHEEGRVLVSDSSTDIYTVGIQAAAAGVDIIIVDYIDYLVKGEGSESKYAEIYIQMNNISRTLGIPFMMLLQPNREAYKSGVPEMWHARYSGMAENVSAQFLVLFEPRSEEDCNGKFPYVEHSMYIVAWKQRFGWIEGCQGPGAIILPKSKNLWSDQEGEWVMVGDVPQKITRQSRREK